MDIPNPQQVKWLILNSKEPLVFKHLLTTDLLKWSLEDWESKLKDDVLEFRSGEFKFTPEPQWERKTAVIKSSFKHFLQHSQSESKQNNWLYFDYKYLNNWFTDLNELRDSISWAPLGFPNLTADDCTIWIGTKGAHTPCHIDTYGFNLIFQVYGRKLWVIAPPEENLKPSRIPYEESSIYSKLNFFSPNEKEFKGVNNCRKVILNPGEVLYLPHKWWHYVENLETAISINVWVPMPEDDEERLGESIVQLFVKQIIELLNKEAADRLLNPNMLETILTSDKTNMLGVINTCKSICKNKLHNKKMRRDDTENIKSHCGINESELLENNEYVEKIPKMSQEDFNQFIEGQRERFGNLPTNEDDDTQFEGNDILELLNVFIDGDVVALMKEKLLKT